MAELWVNEIVGVVGTFFTGFISFWWDLVASWFNL